MKRLIQSMGSLQTAAELLHCVPDIACFAKLMTGGIIPLSATLASNSVFESFIGDSKVITARVMSATMSLCYHLSMRRS